MGWRTWCTRISGGSLSLRGKARDFASGLARELGAVCGEEDLHGSGARSWGAMIVTIW